MLADASSTTAVGSQSCCATSTATSATRNVAVSVAKSARFVEVGELGRQLFDLAADLGQLRLDLEDVGDLGRARGDGLERRFAGPEVPDPRLEIDDLAGHLDRVGLLGDDLGREAVQAAQCGRARPPSGRPGSGR